MCCEVGFGRKLCSLVLCAQRTQCVRSCSMRKKKCMDLLVLVALFQKHVPPSSFGIDLKIFAIPVLVGGVEKIFSLDSDSPRNLGKEDLCCGMPGRAGIHCRAHSCVHHVSPQPNLPLIFKNRAEIAVSNHAFPLRLVCFKICYLTPFLLQLKAKCFQVIGIAFHPFLSRVVIFVRDTTNLFVVSPPSYVPIYVPLDDWLTLVFDDCCSVCLPCERSKLQLELVKTYLCTCSHSNGVMRSHCLMQVLLCYRV